MRKQSKGLKRAIEANALPSVKRNTNKPKKLRGALAGMTGYGGITSIQSHATANGYCISTVGHSTPKDGLGHPANSVGPGTTKWKGLD